MPDSQALDLLHEGKDREEMSLVPILILEKTSLQGNKALLTVGLSLTAARLVKEMTVASRSTTAAWNTRVCSVFTSGGWLAVNQQNCAVS